MKKIKQIGVALLIMAVLVAALPCFTVSAAEGTTFYVAVDGKGGGRSQDDPMSLAFLNSNVYLQGGDKVLFKSGDIFYGVLNPTTMETTNEKRVEFGAYGKGELPVFSGAKIITDKWEKIAGGFYKCDLTDKNNYLGFKDDETNIAFIEDINGVKYGTRQLTSDTCKEEYDFYCDEQYIYIKSYKDPYKTLGALKLATGVELIKMTSNTVFHDLNVRDAGYGFVWKDSKDTAQTKNVHIYNCVIENLGGHYIGGLNSGVKGGNGIEFFNNGDNCLVENNIIRNCYDVAFTCQGDGVWTNITVKNNILAYNTQAFEIWCDTKNAAMAGVNGLKFTNNIAINQGQGWGYKAREGKDVAVDFLTYQYNAQKWNMTIKDNEIFHSSNQPAIYYCSTYSEKDFVSKIKPNNDVLVIPKDMKEIFRSDIITQDMAAWQARGCDTNSKITYLESFDKHKTLEELALTSLDFNAILAEAKNNGLGSFTSNITRDSNLSADFTTDIPKAEKSDDTQQADDGDNKSDSATNDLKGNKLENDDNNYLIPIICIAVPVIVLLAFIALIILMKKHKI